MEHAIERLQGMFINTGSMPEIEIFCAISSERK